MFQGLVKQYYDRVARLLHFQVISIYHPDQLHTCKTTRDYGDRFLDSSGSFFVDEFSVKLCRLFILPEAQNDES